MDTARQLHLTVHKSNSLRTQFSQAAESIWICQDFILKSINASCLFLYFLFSLSLFLSLNNLSLSWIHSAAEKDAPLIQTLFYLFTTET